MRIRPAGHAGGEDTTYTNSLSPRKAQASRGRLVTHDLNVRVKGIFQSLETEVCELSLCLETL